MKLKVKVIKENQDGSAEIEITFDKEIENIIKKKYKCKTITKTVVKKFFVSLLKLPKE